MGEFLNQTLICDDFKEKIVTFKYVRNKMFYKAKDFIIKQKDNKLRLKHLNRGLISLL